MKKIILATLVAVLSMGAYAQEKTLHDFTVKTITGQDYNLAQLKGKKVLVVNVATYCKFSFQYVKLQEMYQKYGPDKFVVIAFPANNFANQEPDSNEQIYKYVTDKYGVTFPMMAKISVKGDDMAPVYKWLTQRKENGKRNTKVLWNFQKYMIDEDGHWVDTVEPKLAPDTPRIIEWIEK